VKFTIEIYATANDESGEPLHRASVSAISPLGARKEARRLLIVWKKRGANGGRVLNGQGQTVYEFSG
jgi:hypothetical protein